MLFGLLIVSLYWGIGSHSLDGDPAAAQSTAGLLYFIMALCGFGAATVVPGLTLDR